MGRVGIQLYIGCKVIKATKMDEVSFLTEIKQQPTFEGQETRLGYYVEYPDGYQSWSPVEAFENAYRVITSQEAFFMLSEAAVNGPENEQPDSADPNTVRCSVCGDGMSTVCRECTKLMVGSDG